LQWKLVYFMAIYLFYGHLIYFTTVCYILWLFGIFCGYLEYFSMFWYVVLRKKSGNPAFDLRVSIFSNVFYAVNSLGQKNEGHSSKLSVCIIELVRQVVLLQASL
jgi:hypothetical protein